MKTTKTDNTKKVRRKKEDPAEEFRHMLELYLMVPPFPVKLKRERRSGNKKLRKVSK